MKVIITRDTISKLTFLMATEYVKVYFLLEVIKVEVLSVTPAESVRPGGHIELALSQPDAARRNGSLAPRGNTLVPFGMF